MKTLLLIQALDRYRLRIHHDEVLPLHLCRNQHRRHQLPPPRIPLPRKILASTQLQHQPHGRPKQLPRNLRFFYPPLWPPNARYSSQSVWPPQTRATRPDPLSGRGSVRPNASENVHDERGSFDHGPTAGSRLDESEYVEYTPSKAVELYGQFSFGPFGRGVGVGRSGEFDSYLGIVTQKIAVYWIHESGWVCWRSGSAASHACKYGFVCTLIPMARESAPGRMAEH